MKKMLSVILSMVMLLTLLAGCDLFTTPTTTAAPSTTQAGDPNPSGNPDPTGDPEPSGTTAPVDTSIKLTDLYSFADPEGIEFDTRYVIYADENSTMVSSSKDYGMLAVYSITYAKDDAPVCGYEFMICDTAEHAQAIIDLYAASGVTLTALEEDPTIVYGTTDKDALEAAIMVYQSYGMISEATVSAYVEFYATTIGGVIQ